MHKIDFTLDTPRPHGLAHRTEHRIIFANPKRAISCPNFLARFKASPSREMRVLGLSSSIAMWDRKTCFRRWPAAGMCGKRSTGASRFMNGAKLLNLVVIALDHNLPDIRLVPQRKAANHSARPAGNEKIPKTRRRSLRAAGQVFTLPHRRELTARPVSHKAIQNLRHIIRLAARDGALTHADVRAG